MFNRIIEGLQWHLLKCYQNALMEFQWKCRHCWWASKRNTALGKFVYITLDELGIERHYKLLNKYCK